MYAAVMKAESVVTVYLKGTVAETKKSHAHIDSFPMAKPGLEIEV